MGTRALAPQLQFVEDAHDELGLTYREISGAVEADESTLHRWRSGESEPRTVFIRRMEALHELQTELLDALHGDAARQWLASQPPALGGRRPRDLILQGEIEPVVRLLLRLNSGIPL